MSVYLYISPLPPIILSVVYNDLQMAIILSITIISETVYCPTKVVIIT